MQSWLVDMDLANAAKANVSLRHANSRITMELYAQALSPDKRKAQSKVIRMILPKANQQEQRLEEAS